MTNPAATAANGLPTIIPGYFTMRTRFEDYKGSYVIHCHILAHEDRGMMLEVDLATNPVVAMQHH
jgi:FtsP/CotA-like multicopper oxidase with cupredoxin domain